MEIHTELGGLAPDQGSSFGGRIMENHLWSFLDLATAEVSKLF